MPTVCEPWPGKTKANGDIAAKRSRDGRPAAAEFTCSLASVIPAPYPAATMSDDRPGRVIARPVTRPAPTRIIARRFEQDLSAPVLAAGSRIRNVRQISERVAMGRALWRELVIGFASQLGELRLGFTQLAALYVLADGSTLTVGELAESINRSPSATSRLIDGLVKRRLVERKAGGGGPTPEDPPPDPARARRAAGRGPWPGRSVPVRGPPVAHGGTGDRGDGRGRAGDPRDQPARSPDPGARARTSESRLRPSHGGTACGSAPHGTGLSIAAPSRRRLVGHASSPSHTRPPRSIRSGRWSKGGRIYACTTCDEKVVVAPVDAGAATGLTASRPTPTWPSRRHRPLAAEPPDHVVEDR